MGETPMRRRLLRLFAIATLVAGAFCAALAIPDARAQRIPPEGREIIDNMSRSERRAFRKLDREERRAYILNLLKKRGIVVEPPKETGGDEKRRGPNPKVLATIDGYLPPTAITPEVRMMVGKNSGGDKDRAVEIQKARGVTETGLTPDFIDGGDCPEIDSETWAIDYSHKRAWAALHKGIDIPQPEGTPIRAVADGTVVGKFENRRNRKGIEIMLRDTPEQTGLPFWTYSQYTHMLAMSPLSIGEKVRMGDEVGQTSNTGKMGRRVRRDALHFAILYAGAGLVGGWPLRRAERRVLDGPQRLLPDERPVRFEIAGGTRRGRKENPRSLYAERRRLRAGRYQTYLALHVRIKGFFGKQLTGTHKVLL